MQSSQGRQRGQAESVAARTGGTGTFLSWSAGPSGQRSDVACAQLAEGPAHTSSSNGGRVRGAEGLQSSEEEQGRRRQKQVTMSDCNF